MDRGGEEEEERVALETKEDRETEIRKEARLKELVRVREAAKL